MNLILLPKEMLQSDANVYCTFVGIIKEEKGESIGGGRSLRPGVFIVCPHPSAFNSGKPLQYYLAMESSTHLHNTCRAI